MGTTQTPAPEPQDPIDTAALLALASEATPGPWEADHTTVMQHWSRPEPWLDVVTDEVNCFAYCYGGSCKPIGNPADTAFIAAANPETVTRLCEEVERLRDAESAAVLAATIAHDQRDAARADLARLRAFVQGVRGMDNDLRDALAGDVAVPDVWARGYRAAQRSALGLLTALLATLDKEATGD